jgi:polyisoprenoid-binding protein YceI
MTSNTVRQLVASVATMFAATSTFFTASASFADSGNHAFDVHRSHISVYVYKRGLFSFAADNHEIEAPIVAGSIDETKKTVDVTVNAAKMEVLDPKLSADRRASVQANMSGSGVLDTAKYPMIVFHSSNVEFDAKGHGSVPGNLTLHGQTHAIVVDLTRVGVGHFTGSATVRQTAFGITPIRIMGGAVTVKDDVNVVFDIFLNVK